MKTTARPRAIVIGCGIGGPVVAMALQRIDWSQRVTPLAGAE